MIQWEINGETRLPVKSWCRDIEDGALQQAKNLANHPMVTGHVALMPDAHVGYGMPIGGVIACAGALIPNAVGVDIGCGMGAIQTNLRAEDLGDMRRLRKIIEDVKMRIPVGEGKARPYPVEWDGFGMLLDSLGNAEKPGWYTQRGAELDACNLGTLGGGNHFIEIQQDTDGGVWLMLHSGSRNLGYRIADYYHKEAHRLNTEMGTELPDPELAFLPMGHDLCSGYIRDMNHALAYAAENRRVMMDHLKKVMAEYFSTIEFLLEVNIHHNYAAEETHGGDALWVHRKGATSARSGEMGIIPGSMGTASYIVEGLGNPDSFESCSHGAGRRMSRVAACRGLTPEECDRAMEGIVFDRWGSSYVKGPDRKKLPDLSEAPQAYKDIDAVIEAELDLITPLVKLRPLAVIKG
ncbi:RtcB family protein [Breznakiella homolactica]|uniref:3'-phosphate/5'-hydroxy nucleic acid ligase n=1 Tax=Breznakiella homolactica TaxID=2798577 RepID=A0A7T7XPQ9_9SPIR|nr:RtcB family protein [Breznakiella homolactica]QQO10259.1 RtcB family protein [Breznakiella homolactica]